MLTVGSLFSGIGGLDFGLERAGMDVRWQVEIDPYAQKVLAKHWPNVKRYGDIRTCTGLERVDVVCGGFPCQDLSNIGKRAGLKGEKSGLWGEYSRVVAEVRPRFVLVENVPAIRTRGLGVVLGDLSALGYVCEWDCLPAAAFGAAHRRDRLYLVAHSGGFGSQRVFSPWAEARAALGSGSRVPPESGVGRTAYGIPFWVQRLVGLGNAVVPQVAEYLGRRIARCSEM